MWRSQAFAAFELKPNTVAELGMADSSAQPLLLIMIAPECSVLNSLKGDVQVFELVSSVQ